MPQVGTCTTTQRRRQERNTSVALRVPTVPTVADSCTAGWITATDIYLAEIFVNRADQRVYTRGTTGIFELTTAIGQPVHGGTTDRILYLDNTAVPLLTSDAKFTRDAATNFTSITATTNVNFEAGIAINDNLFGLGTKGVGIEYFNGTNDSLDLLVGDDSGTTKFNVNHSDGTTSTVINLEDGIIALSANDDGGIKVILDVRDPEGVVLQGKDSGAVNHVLTLYDGNAVQFAGTALMRVRNDGEFQVGRRFCITAPATTLTESSATIFNSMTVATETADAGIFFYSVEADDGTDYQVVTGTFFWSVVNKAGTLTFDIDPSGTNATAVSAGTLTATFTLTDEGAGVLAFRANAVSSLTQTTLQIKQTFLKQYDAAP